MKGLREAKELLKSLVIIGDEEKIEIAKADRCFATKSNAYNVKTDDCSVAIKTMNKEISWIQTFANGRVRIEIGDFAFTIETGVKL